MADNKKKIHYIKATIDFDVASEIHSIRKIVGDYSLWGEMHNIAVDLLDDIEDSSAEQAFVDYLIDNYPFNLTADKLGEATLDISMLIIFLEENADEIRENLHLNDDEENY